MAGMSVEAFLNETDTFNRNVMVLVATAWIDIQRKMDQNRATMIANAVGKMLGAK